MACQNRKQIGGCQLHNVQCGYPLCDKEPYVKLDATTASDIVKSQNKLNNNNDSVHIEIVNDILSKIKAVVNESPEVYRITYDKFLSSKSKKILKEKLFFVIDSEIFWGI